MTGIFEPIELTWGDRKFVVPPSRVLRAIATIEEVLTLQQVTSGNVPTSKLAMAYGALLRFAGCKVTDDEVYVFLFGDGALNVVSVIQALLMIMIPKSVIKMVEKRIEVAGDEALVEGKEVAPIKKAS